MSIAIYQSETEIHINKQSFGEIFISRIVTFRPSTHKQTANMLLNFNRLARLVLLSLVAFIVISVSAEDTLVDPAVPEVPAADNDADTRNALHYSRPPPGCGCSGPPPKPHEPKPKPCPCLPVPKDFCYQTATVPIYRYYDKVAKDHFYSQSKPEALKETKKWASEINYEGVAFRCYAKPEEGTVPLYAYYNNEVGDNFYTVDWNECKAAASGWHYTGILCYISPVARKGTLQLFRYWSPRRTDHFYTTGWEELGCGTAHWISENSPGYVCPRHKNDDPISACEGSFGEKKELGQETKAPEVVVVSL